jgi:hypothetical protein
MEIDVGTGGTVLRPACENQKLFAVMPTAAYMPRLTPRRGIFGKNFKNLISIWQNSLRQEILWVSE